MLKRGLVVFPFNVNVIYGTDSHALNRGILSQPILRSLYLSAAIEKRGLQPLLDNLRKLGGWPVLEGERWNGGDFTWKDCVYRFRKLGYSVDYFIDFGVSVDLKNNSRRLIDVRYHW